MKKPYNAGGQLVFSKFDFSTNIPVVNNENTSKKPDLKQLLNQVMKKKEEVKALQDSGKIEDAVKLKEQFDWENALSKAQGEKVKDDPALLEKSLKRKEYQKKTSGKKWTERNQQQEKYKNIRQNVRRENLKKRKQQKVEKKMKKMKKRGHMVPGF